MTGWLSRVFREILAVGGMAGLQWRDLWGSPSRLPPGTLNPLAIPRLQGSRCYLNKQQRYGPIFKTVYCRRLAICVVGFRTARRLLAAHGSRLKPITIRIEPSVPKGFLRQMNPPDHPRYRRLFSDAFRADLLDSHEPRLREILRGCLDRQAGRELTLTGQFDAAIEVVTLQIMLGLFLGVWPDDPEAETLQQAFHRLGPRHFVSTFGPAQREAFAAIREILALHWSGVAPGGVDGRSNCVLGRIARFEPGRAWDENVVGNLIYMIEMGRYDLRGLFTWILYYLAKHPGSAEELLDESGACRSDWVNASVLETLRLDQAEALNRRVAEEFDFDGYLFPKGTTVRLLLRESHRDPQIFPDPDQYDPRRFINRRYTGDEFAPFGLDEHRCVAADMVLHLSGLLVEELVREYRCSLAHDGPRILGPFHWEPNPACTVLLDPRNPRTGSEQGA